MNLTCIINPRAGHKAGPQAVAEAVHRLAEPLGWRVTTVQTEEPEQGTQLAREAAGKSDLIVVAGGDGTVHETASALVGTDTALGIIPTGSGNGLARALGIPMSIPRAVALLAANTRRMIDVGKVNDHLFFSTAGLGFDAEVGRRFNEGKHRRGILPYLRYGLSAWLDFLPERMTIDLAGRREEETPLLFVVANTDQYGYGAIIAPGAVPNDGTFKVCRIEPMSTLRLLFNLPRLFLGTLDRSPHFHSFSASALIVERADSGWVQVDGETVEMDAKLSFSLLPKALTVIAPTK